MFQLEASVQAAGEDHAEDLHAGNANAHGPNDSQVLLNEGLQLSDTASLHFIDVGGMVPFATASYHSLTAAVRNHAVVCLTRADPLTVSPVLRVVAATTVELQEAWG